MVYLLGMSHLISILAAAARTDIRNQVPHSFDGESIRFVDWDCKPGILPAPMRFASIHYWHLPDDWGKVLAQIEAGKVQINPHFVRLLKEIDHPETEPVLFLSIKGQEHNDLALRVYPIGADFELPWRTDLPLHPDNQIVPFSSVENVVTMQVEEMRAIMYAVRGVLPKVRIVNIVPPPPATTDAVARIFNVSRDVVPPWAIRLKIYLAYERVMRMTTDMLGIETLPPPSSTLSDDGLLLADFAKDTHHGNARYGAEVIKQMSSLMEGTF
jgi:hypothetical protein